MTNSERAGSGSSLRAYWSRARELFARAGRARELLSPSSLAAKLILLSVVLAATIVFGTFLAMSFEVRTSTHRLIAETLNRNQALLLKAQERASEQLLWTSSLIAETPTLRAAIETYRTETSGGSPSRPDLINTIQSESDKIARAIGRDLLVITDEQGKLLAVSGPETIRREAARDPGRLARTFESLVPSLAQGERRFQLVSVGGVRYQLGCVPILLDGYAIGNLALGSRVDDSFVRELQENFDGQVVVTAGDRIVASTLPGSAAQVRKALRGSAHSDGAATIRVAGEEYVSAPLPLGTDQDGKAVTLHLLHSLSQPFTAARLRLVTILIGYGSVAVILAGLASWAASVSVLSPLRRFVSFLESVAESGDYARRFEEAGSAKEMRVLTESYGRFIDSLAQEQVRVGRLRESEKMAALGRMLSGAAHEINNPLTGVIGQIDLLLANEELPPTARGRLERMQKDGRRVVELVRNVLRISHRTDGKRTAVDLNRTIDEALAVRRHDFTTAGIAIEFEREAGPLSILGNGLELQQVFLNVIVNAYDVLREQTAPVLRIRTARMGPSTTVTFEDNGPGISHPERVFEPFFTTKEVGLGTGLGLAISYEILREHGGQIAAYNRSGGGACFAVTLPLADAMPSPEPVQPAMAEPRSATARSLADRNLVALIVDDEPSVLEIQAEILRLLGCRVVTATNGAEAVRALEEQEFGLVVSDMNMPGGISGPDLYRWVEANRPAIARHFLFTSGDTLAESTQAFLGMVGRRSLAKPFSIQEYVDVVQEVLDDEARAA